MLNADNFKDALGDWHPKMLPMFTTGIMDGIYDTLKRDGKRGVLISPLPKDTFAAFNKCWLWNLKCVFIGLAPYATFTPDGKPVSDGLAFSCSVTQNEQPSLKLILDGVQDDLKQEAKRFTDLSFWAYQGVLLINIALTAKKNQPESYIELWNPFMSYLFEEILTTQTGLPIVYFGKEAAKFEPLSLPFGHYNKVVEHPAFSARQNREWKHDNVFSWVNKILTEHDQLPIEWQVSQDRYDELMEREGPPF